jgi:hypothetical protein
MDRCATYSYSLQVFTFRGVPARDVFIEDCGIIDETGKVVASKPVAPIAPREQLRAVA